MNKSYFVFGPQGSGKTRHAKALAKHFGLSKIVDEYDGRPLNRRECMDTLYLSQQRPEWADDDARRVISISNALKQAGIANDAAVRA